MSFRRELSALLLFGVAFGYVEAAVVVYLRTIDEPARRHARPARTADDVFPLSRPSDWRGSGQQTVCTRIVLTELGREFATLVMLAAVALAAARNFRQWFAGFMIAFGMWDIFYYVFLKVLIDWPASLWTWDILFGLPVAWAGPVIAPVLVAGEMTLGGSLILWSERVGTPIGFGKSHWAAILGGGLIMVTAFCWDFRNITAGGMPNPFNWPLFILGNVLGSAGFLHAWGWRTPATSTSTESGGRIA
jgi:hypothetical protein